MYDAEVNHCLIFEQVSDEVIEYYKIENGNFDTISECKYSVPSYLDIGKLYIVSVPEEDLGKIEVLADIDWAMLIAYHRGRMEKIAGTELYKKYAEMDKGYDIIIGKIANDRMFYVLDSFFQGNVTDIALIKSLSALQLGSQYVAVTQKACDTICIEKEVPLLWMERQILKEASEKNRQKGIEFANQICKDYRREGRYFDEIIDDAKLG